MGISSFSSSKSVSRVLVIILVTILVVTAQNDQQSSSRGARTNQWFEETIDEFLRQASDSGDATDIQVSTCKISSQQLVATAQATAARVLKGVCNPSEIESRFQNLERQLGEQFNSLKSALLSMQEKLVDQDQESKRHYRAVMGHLSGMKQRSRTGGSTVIDNESPFPTAYTPAIPHRAEEVVDENEDLAELLSTSSQGPSSSSNLSPSAGGFVSSGATSGSTGPRSEEINKYNSTVHIENGKRAFSYYWSVPGMKSKLETWHQKRALRSNSFYIYRQGYRMYLKLIPRFSSSTAYIHVGLTKGEHDAGLEWPFTFKMRASILSQDTKSKPHPWVDLKSRIWDPKELCSGTNWRKPVVADNPECVGLGFSHAVINTSEYIWNDRLIIKLTIYLD